MNREPHDGRHAFHQVAADFPEPFRLLVRETSASTNDDARELASQGAAHGLVVLALQQTAGRGRRGNVWHASPGDSLAFSIILRPSEPVALWPRLALVAGLAVARACEDFRLQPGIKWPNDIHLHGRKAAGILVEAGSGFAIVGIGINVNTLDFPDQLAGIATSLAREGGRSYATEELLLRIVLHFARIHTKIAEGFEDIIRAVAERCVLTGHRVSMVTASGRIDGIVEGISPSGGLWLATPHGLEHIIQADEIRPHDPTTH